jgi:hypothetical protein
MPTNVYGLGIQDLISGAIIPQTHTMNAMLITASYTPNFDTDHFVSTIRANEVGASGTYAANGTVVAFTNAYVTAASATARANTTAYSVGEIVRPATTNGHVWRCVVAGTTTGAEPGAITTFSGAAGQSVTDGTVTWAECGRGYVKCSPTPANVSWTSATITARYMVIADFNPGTDATRNLLACIDFGSNQTSTAGTFTVTFDSLALNGLILIPIPS